MAEVPFFMLENPSYDQYTIGKYSYGKPQVLQWDEGAKLNIGKFCSIADDVKIFLGGNHRIDWVTTFPFPAFPEEWPSAELIKGHPSTKGDVSIGNDVWIGNGATILSGVKIGNGAVIGASAVIARDIPDYAIAVGNPAKVVKYRFSEETISKLAGLRWWDWDDDKIKKKLPLLCRALDDENIGDLF